jgi:hypothetical protein
MWYGNFHSVVIAGIFFCSFFNAALAEDEKGNTLPKSSVKMPFYLLIGQSNMAGRGKYNPQEDSFPKGKVFILDDKDKFKELQPYPFINHYSTIRKSAAQISPGYSFGKELLKDDPETAFGFVSNARGGTSIEEWKKGTHYFNEAVRRTKEAMKDGELKAILWHQGETDYREVIKHKGEEKKYLEAYFENLRQFIKDLRAEIGAEKIPFIAGQLNSGFAPFNERILTLPNEIDNVYVVKTDGLKTVDDSHFDRDSVLELGRRYAEKLKEVNALNRK